MAAADKTKVDALGTAAFTSSTAYATAAQGATADTAVQPAALTTALSTKADLVGGKVPSAQIPAIAISDYLGAVANQAAMLALTGQRGDWCIRLDRERAWILSGDDASQLTNWVELPTPVDAVTSVNGQTGVVVLGPSDVGAVSTSDARLTDAREWIASTVSQAEAEAGTATTRRAWTAERVFQAIAAWWAASTAKTKLDGISAGATANSTDAQLRDRSTHTGTQAASTITGLATVATSGAYGDLSGKPTLGTAAALNVGTSASNVVQLDGSARLPAVDGSQLTGINANTNLSYTASTRLLESSTGTDVTLPLATTSDAGLQSAADKIKLDGIATGATANATDAQLRDRSTHTGTQSVSTITGLGDAATLNVGTTAGTVAAGDDSRLSNTRTPTDGSVTDAKIDAAGLSASSINWTAITAWAPSTSYAKGALVEYLGIAYRRSAAGTSGATFNTANWQQVTPTNVAQAVPNVSTSAAGLAPATSFAALTYGATTDLDMAALDGQYRTITLTGDLTFTTSNRATGRTVVIRLLPGASTRTLTFPSGWVFVGTKPATLAASKTAVLSLTFFGTADTDCVAAYAVQT